MSEYRFHLQKYSYGSKISCPNCGKSRCFVRYVDEEGIIRFPDTVGKCDHENSCGYHYTPREYFHDHPDTLQVGSQSLQKPSFPIEKNSTHVPPIFIYPKVVERSLADYGRNPLYRYLCGVFGETETTRLFSLYKVGTSNKWGGSTVYWQTDISGKVRTGKIMLYDSATGHRIKRTACLCRLGTFGIAAYQLPSAAMPVRRTSVDYFCYRTCNASRERENSHHNEPFHFGLHLACNRWKEWVLQ